MMLVLAIVEIFSVILQRIFCDSTLKKKKIRRYTDYLVWGGYFAVFNGVTYVLTYLGDGTSNIWLNILLFVCIFFVLKWSINIILNIICGKKVKETDKT